MDLVDRASDPRARVVEVRRPTDDGLEAIEATRVVAVEVARVGIARRGRMRAVGGGSGARCGGRGREQRGGHAVTDTTIVVPAVLATYTVCGSSGSGATLP